MYPIVTRYGPFFLYTYQVVMGLGMAICFGWLAWSARRRSPGPRALDGVLWAAGAALVGGRLAFVAWHWDYYATHPAEILIVRQGGLAYHGALSTGLLTLWLWCRRQGCSPARYGDWLAPALALMSAFGWLACYCEGCAFGRETWLAWYSADLPDNYGLFAVRFQTQLAGLLFTLAVAALAFTRRRSFRPGIVFGLTLAALGFGQAALSLTRGEFQPQWGWVSYDTLFHLLVASVGLLAVRRAW